VAISNELMSLIDNHCEKIVDKMESVRENQSTCAVAAIQNQRDVTWRRDRCKVVVENEKKMEKKMERKMEKKVVKE
jgi:uncharacterized protein involved in tellurium resistance